MSGDLCEELIIEIFTRLPSKSLLRFRSVSKSLCSLIGSPDFIRMHTSRSPQKVLIRHENKNKNGIKKLYTLHSEEQLPLIGTCRYIGIPAVKFPYWGSTKCAGSCNGIICLFHKENYRIILWNPSIRRQLTLPHSPTDRCPECSCNLYRVGFGFDSVTDAYKIVSLPKYGGHGKSSYVYTMKTGYWCKIASPIPWYFKVASRGCFVNGALHWVACKSDEGGYHILTFNLSTHVFGEIAVPELSADCELTIIQGSLAVITNGNYSCIWVMRQCNDTASWSVLVKSKGNKAHEILQKVLQLKSNDDLLLVKNFWSFQVYDTKSGARSGLLNLNDSHYICGMELCVESLELLDVGTRARNISRRGQ